MLVVQCDSPEEFLKATTSYRMAEPFLTNVLGSVAQAVAEGSQKYDDYWWWVIRDDRGSVVGAAFRTAPFGLSLGPMSAESASVLARKVATVDDVFPWILGPEEIVEAFLVAYRTEGTEGSGRVAKRTRRDLIYVIDKLSMPRAEGTARLATIEDFDLAFEWYVAFSTLMDGVAPTPDENDRASLSATLRAGRLRFWCVDGTPVSMAGHAVPVETPRGVVVRVGPVFTPEESRRHGFGVAVTAALTANLLEQGFKVMLYADADNPTSNSIYQTIGYQLLQEIARYELSPARR